MTHVPPGILAVAKPCSVVVNVKELFHAESTTQVYAHLHELIQSPVMQDIGMVTCSYFQLISDLISIQQPSSYNLRRNDNGRFLEKPRKQWETLLSR